MSRHNAKLRGKLIEIIQQPGTQTQRINYIETAQISWISFFINWMASQQIKAFRGDEYRVHHNCRKWCIFGFTHLAVHFKYRQKTQSYLSFELFWEIKSFDGKTSKKSTVSQVFFVRSWILKSWEKCFAFWVLLQIS